MKKNRFEFSDLKKKEIHAGKNFAVVAAGLQGCHRWLLNIAVQSPLSYRTMLVTRFLLHRYMRPRWTTWIGPMHIVFSANFFDGKTHGSNRHDLCLAGKMLDRGCISKTILSVGSVCLSVGTICTEHYLHRTDSCSPSRSHISVQQKWSYKHGPIRERRLCKNREWPGKKDPSPFPNGEEHRSAE